MKLKKILGYCLSVIGVGLIAITFPEVTKVVTLPLPAGITNNYLLIGGIVLVAIGIFFVMGKDKIDKRQKAEEVPIYEGKQVVGYRRSN